MEMPPFPSELVDENRRALGLPVSDERPAFDERAEFEASMRSCSTISLQRDPEDPENYYRSVTEAAWIAWQIRAGLELPGSRGLAALRSPITASGNDPERSVG